MKHIHSAFFRGLIDQHLPVCFGRRCLDAVIAVTEFNMLFIYRVYMYLAATFIIMLIAHDSHAQTRHPGDVDGSDRGTHYQRPVPNPAAQRSEVALVIASMKADDTSWVERYLPDSWRAQKYMVDDRSAPLTVPANKGHEAVVYLTHIIDAYEDNTAPPYLIFVQGIRLIISPTKLIVSKEKTCLPVCMAQRRSGLRRGANAAQFPPRAPPRGGIREHEVRLGRRVSGGVTSARR